MSFGIRDVWRYRELLYFFAWKDIKVRYKQSLIGAGWAIVQPMTMMIVFTVVFGRLAKIPSEGIPRPLFYFSGLILWTYFSQAMSQATMSLVSSASMLSKVYFPRVLLPASSVVGGLVDFLAAFVVLIGMTVFYVVRGESGARLDASLALIPVLLVLVVGTAFAGGLWLSTIYVRYRDVKFATPFILQFWLFASPVAYPTGLVPEQWQLVYAINPLTGPVQAFRWIVSGRGSFPGAALVISALVVIVAVITGLYVFRQFEGTAADVI
ncbi:MAG: ABC transporter permease [Actinomycetota bacterium]